MVDSEGKEATAEGPRAIWATLDDALQVLVRAESLVMLLRCAYDVEEHHRYGAEVACDHLRELKQRLEDAQAQLSRARVGEVKGSRAQKCEV